MGRRLTAVAWLERDYDALFAEGDEIVYPPGPMAGLKVTSYAPDPGGDGFRPLFSIKQDDVSPEPRGPDAAFWPHPQPWDDLDQESWRDW